MPLFLNINAYTSSSSFARASERVSITNILCVFDKSCNCVKSVPTFAKRFISQEIFAIRLFAENRTKKDGPNKIDRLESATVTRIFASIFTSRFADHRGNECWELACDNAF